MGLNASHQSGIGCTAVGDSAVGSYDARDRMTWQGTPSNDDVMSMMMALSGPPTPWPRLHVCIAACMVNLLLLVRVPVHSARMMLR